ncbi:MAG: HAMP domain-containing histidine kinase [Sphingomonadales bacterium]|nr:HAMP domain-containing histidine kinase [Sphingomonadales bacterium]
MKLTRSLTFRMLAVEIAGILVVLAIMAALAIALMQKTIDAQQGALLGNQAGNIETALTFHDRQPALELTGKVRAAYDSAIDGRFYLLVGGDGAVLLRSPESRLLSPAAIPRGAHDLLFHAGALVGFSRPISTPAGPAWIVVGQDQAAAAAILDDVARAFLLRYIVVLIVVLALLPAINALILRQLGRRVREVADQAESIGPQNPGQRLDETRLPREVASLARATNRLVERLEKAVAQQRAFVANVTHELKTPLATLRMQIDAIAPEQRARLGSSVDSLSHVISQMRALAELESLDAAARDAFDLGELARNMAENLAPQIYADGHRLELRLPEGPVPVSAGPILIELAIRNLVDNARQHTPAGTTIAIEVSPQGELAVSDDGPGIAEEIAPYVKRRFWRADQSRTDTAGLGLSIVERICEVHGTRLGLMSNPGKGARFSFILRRL